MSLNKPRTQHGFHQATATSITDGIPYGTIKVLANYSATSEREQQELFGGSNPNSWDSEAGKITSDLSLTFKEFKPFIYKLAGYTVTTNAAEAHGSVIGRSGIGSTGSVTLTNITAGTLNSTGVGIASLSATTGIVKDGKFIVKAVSATTVDVYAVSDVSFNSGTAIAYQNDTLKITTAALTITAGSTVAIPGLNVSLKGGTGPIGMTIGATAFFTLRSANEESYSYSLGANPVPIEFGLHLISQKKSNGEYMEDYFPRVKFSSIPSGMDMGTWKEDITVPIKIMYDATLGTAKVRNDIVKDLT